MPLDLKPAAWFAAGTITGAVAIAYLRKQLKPARPPSVIERILGDQDIANFPKELLFLLRTSRRQLAKHLTPIHGEASVQSEHHQGDSMTVMPREPATPYNRKPGKTDVVRIALTGGPCGGKSSALSAIQMQGKKLGFDVYIAPETATLIFAAGFEFRGPTSPELKLSFQLAMQRLQLQLERSLTAVASATGRPSIIVFDRGLLDSKAYNSAEGWQKILKGIGAGDEYTGQITGVTEGYLLARYDAVLHLVTAANGAETFYKFGWTVDDSGNKVFRRESPQEARDLDQKMLEVWKDHPKHFVFHNAQEGKKTDFTEKIQLATAAVMEVANAKHPSKQ